LKGRGASTTCTVSVGRGRTAYLRGKRDEELLRGLSADIMLFKRHPEATRARNLLHCRVGEIFNARGRIGVGLECGDERLVALVVRRTLQEWI
jgi:molybdate transport system ATP-binding protein